jgi:hypothetical protein
LNNYSPPCQINNTNGIYICNKYKRAVYFCSANSPLWSLKRFIIKDKPNYSIIQY